MPDYENILYEKQRDGVLITLNRPEVMNAISVTNSTTNSTPPSRKQTLTSR